MFRACALLCARGTVGTRRGAEDQVGGQGGAAAGRRHRAAARHAPREASST